MDAFWRDATAFMLKTKKIHIQAHTRTLALSHVLGILLTQLCDIIQDLKIHFSNRFLLETTW